MTRTAVQIAAKLYEAHDAMRRLLGEAWPERSAKYQGYIREAMAKWNLGELAAAQRLVAELQKRTDTGPSQALVLAAVVEMIEPSVAKEGQ